MEFRNIITFLKVAELKNFSKAAEKLGYSQSAVTVQIHQLEKELGTRLFERLGKSIDLTDSGKEFVFYANEILRTASQAAESVKRTDSGAARDDLMGVLRIGSAESVLTALLPEILIEFHQRFPKVEIIVQTADRIDTFIEQIKSNRLDLLVTLERKAEYPGLVRQLLRQEEIIFIVPSGWEKKSGGKALWRKEEAAALPFVLTEKGESYRHELERLLAEFDLSIKAQLEIGNTETIVHMVEAGFGASFLPYFSARKALERGSVQRIETDLPPLAMWTQMYYHKNKWISPQMEAFIAVLREYLGCPGLAGSEEGNSRGLFPENFEKF